jgi:hypothetical protein
VRRTPGGAKPARLRVDIDGETVAIVPRTTSREIHRYEAYATRLLRSL